VSVATASARGLPANPVGRLLPEGHGAPRSAESVSLSPPKATPIGPRGGFAGRSRCRRQLPCMRSHGFHFLSEGTHSCTICPPASRKNFVGGTRSAPVVTHTSRECSEQLPLRRFHKGGLQ
jgi:hypothetical protein